MINEIITREGFIKVLEENKIPYHKAEDTGIWKEGYDGVYVYSRKEYELKNAHPKKYKNLYVPYFRVSDFGSGEYYLRENGWTMYCNESYLRGLIEEYK